MCEQTAARRPRTSNLCSTSAVPDPFARSNRTLPPSDHELDALATAALERSGAAGIAIALEAEGTIVCRARAGEIAPAVGARAESGIAGHALRSRQIQRCLDTESDPRVNRQVCRELGVRSMVVVPVRQGDRIIGLVSAFYRQPTGFTEGAVGVLETIADALGEETEPIAPAATVGDEQPRAPVFLPEPPAESLLRRAVPALMVAAAVVVVAVGLLLYRANTEGYRAAAKEPEPQPLVTVSPTPAGAAPADPVRAAAEAGDAAAQYELALAYIHGDTEPRDYGEAAKWLTRAAEAGNSSAQITLADAYRMGRGVNADPVQACAWLIIAEANHNDDAKAPLRELTARMSAQQIAGTRYELGRMYAAGRGVRADRVSAYMWFVLADEAGSPEAPQAMAILRSLMTPEQVQDANQRASDWLARHRGKG